MPTRRTVVEIDAALADVAARIDALYTKGPDIADLMAHGHSLAEAITIATEAARARPPFDYAESNGCASSATSSCASATPRASLGIIP